MRRCVEFFLQNSKTGVPGLRNNYFYLDEMQWKANGTSEEPLYSSRALGETWSDLARILRCCRENNIPEPQGALEALREGLQFFLDHRLPGGAVPLMWKKDGTPGSDKITCAGSSVLVAFFEFYRLTGEEEWRDRAVEMLELFTTSAAMTLPLPFLMPHLMPHVKTKRRAFPFSTLPLWLTRSPAKKSSRNMPRSPQTGC